MQGDNWGILLLLTLVVVVYALIRAHLQRDKEDDADAPENAEGGPDGTASKPDDAKHAVPVEIPWAECQMQLNEAPPLSECDGVDFDMPEEAGAAPEAEIQEGIEPETEVDPVPPSSHSINTDIRTQAGRLFRENYRKTLPLSGTFVALTAIRILLKSGVLPIDKHFNADGFIALIEPLIALGAAYAAVRLWKGEPPRLGMLVHFLREGRFFPALGFMLINMAFLALLAVAAAGGLALIRRSAARFGPGEEYQAFQLANSLSFILLILVLCTMVWLLIWLAMAGFAYIRTPERGVITSIKSGFRTGNQCFGRILGMLAAVGWPFGVVVIIQLISATWIVKLQQPLAMIAVNTPNLLLTLFYGGYVLLSMAGLAERILPEGSGAPRAEANLSGGDGPIGDGLPEGHDPSAGDGNAEAAAAGDAPEDGMG